MGLFTKGHYPWNLRKPCSEATRLLLSRRIKEALQSPIVQEKLRRRKESLTPEARENMRQAHLGMKLSEETKAKISQKLKGKLKGKSYEEIYGDRAEEIKRKIGLAGLGSKRPFSPEAKARQAIKNKQQWQDPIYREHTIAGIMRACHTKPNKKESQLNDILQRNFPNEWRFVGDWQLVIGGKFPDFANINGKKQLIELFGTHWHKLFDVAERTEHYCSYGYKTLIIWEDELDNETKVIKRIRKFTKEVANA